MFCKSVRSILGTKALSCPWSFCTSLTMLQLNNWKWNKPRQTLNFLTKNLPTYEVIWTEKLRLHRTRLQFPSLFISVPGSIDKPSYWQTSIHVPLLQSCPFVSSINPIEAAATLIDTHRIAIITVIDRIVSKFLFFSSLHSWTAEH